MRKFCWVYQDRITNDLVLVMRPHRRESNPKYRVVSAYYKRNGFRPDTFICLTSKTVASQEFRNQYEYLGGLNQKGGKKRTVKMAWIPGLGKTELRTP